MTRRHRAISVFVAVWLCVFTYETLRAGYLNPVAHRQLPKLPLLFPPAGWIMFYAVDRSYGYAEVYGIRGRQMERLDPHRIFTTRSVGYDNIRRNLLIGVLSPGAAGPFCRYLRWRLPGYDSFAVAYAQIDDVVARPDAVQRRLVYECK